MVLNNHFELPYNKFAPEGSVPIISKSLVKARLSNKFAEISNMNNSEENNNYENIEQFERKQEEMNHKSKGKSAIK